MCSCLTYHNDDDDDDIFVLNKFQNVEQKLII